MARERHDSPKWLYAGCTVAANAHVPPREVNVTTNSQWKYRLSIKTFFEWTSKRRDRSYEQEIVSVHLLGSSQCLTPIPGPTMQALTQCYVHTGPIVVSHHPPPCISHHPPPCKHKKWLDFPAAHVDERMHRSQNDSSHQGSGKYVDVFVLDITEYVL